MEKLDFDLSVIIQEKNSYKKELDQADISLRLRNNEYKEVIANYTLLKENNEKTLDQNAEYRALIIENEQKMKLHREEI